MRGASRRGSMCPNEQCEKFGEETRLMGGCECGVALVPFVTADELLRAAAWDLLRPEVKQMLTRAIAVRKLEGR